MTDNVMSEVERLRQENARWERSFDLYWKANMRGVAMWQAAHPGNELVFPDTGNLVEWLIEELDKARKNAEDHHHQGQALHVEGRS